METHTQYQALSRQEAIVIEREIADKIAAAYKAGYVAGVLGGVKKTCDGLRKSMREG
jgi:methionine synthase I (cobalamin-dependent)